MSQFWFDFTKDIIPNHMISVDVKDMPEFFQQPQFDGNSMKCKKLTMIPMECIVRGYITGSGWESYKRMALFAELLYQKGYRNRKSCLNRFYTVYEG